MELGRQVLVYRLAFHGGSPSRRRGSSPTRHTQSERSHVHHVGLNLLTLLPHMSQDQRINCVLNLYRTVLLQNLRSATSSVLGETASPMWMLHDAAIFCVSKLHAAGGRKVSKYCLVGICGLLLSCAAAATIVPLEQSIYCMPWNGFGSADWHDHAGPSFKAQSVLASISCDAGMAFSQLWTFLKFTHYHVLSGSSASRVLLHSAASWQIWKTTHEKQWISPEFNRIVCMGNVLLCFSCKTWYEV